ncbi:MAG: molybdopterin cofactor-binding domain-containing protein, partial [Tistlia sp.]
MAPFDEDRLLTGRGRYLEDRTPEGCLHMAVLRSPLAHAGVAGLDVTAARAAPGVRLVLTAADLERLGIGPLACRASVTSRDGTAMIEPHRPVLAGAAVKHVGQPIAAVVAETLEAALDALEAIELSLDELPTVVEVEAAATAGAPAIWEEAPGNRAFDWEIGNRAETEAAFADAAHVVALTVRHPRIVIAPIETRGALAAYDAGSGRFTLWTASQGVVSLRTALANCLGIEGGRLRVVTEDVGGSFAVKIWPYPEQVLALAAARETGRPVKWTASRSEAMVADAMGRGRV